MVDLFPDDISSSEPLLVPTPLSLMLGHLPPDLVPSGLCVRFLLVTRFPSRGNLQ